jgi:hypothetical protein
MPVPLFVPARMAVHGPGAAIEVNMPDPFVPLSYGEGDGLAAMTGFSIVGSASIVCASLAFFSFSGCSAASFSTWGSDFIGCCVGVGVAAVKGGCVVGLEQPTAKRQQVDKAKAVRFILFNTRSVRTPRPITRARH